MSRTSLNTKVSTVEKNEAQDAAERSDLSKNSNESGNVEATKFSTVPKNDWKAMTSSGSDISDMLDCMNGVERQSQYRGPIDALLDSLSITRQSASSREFSASYDLPPVPEIDEILLEAPDLQNNMESLVEKCELIKETLQELLVNSYNALNSGTLTASEARQTQDRIQAIQERLEANEEQLAIANYYYELQLEREEIAQALAEAETEED